MRAIDADALTASLKKSADRCRDWIQECINIKDDVTQRVAEQSLLTFTECYLRIEKMPTIEPQRMRGKWIDGHRMSFDGTFHWYRMCSECDYERDDDSIDLDTNFCPNCGAWMGGQDEVD